MGQDHTGAQSSGRRRRGRRRKRRQQHGGERAQAQQQKFKEVPQSSDTPPAPPTITLSTTTPDREQATAVCVVCGKRQGQAAFSAIQWGRRSTSAGAKCTSCLTAPPPPTANELAAQYVHGVVPQQQWSGCPRYKKCAVVGSQGEHDYTRTPQQPWQLQQQQQQHVAALERENRQLKLRNAQLEARLLAAETQLLQLSTVKTTGAVAPAPAVKLEPELGLEPLQAGRAPKPRRMLGTDASEKRQAAMAARAAAERMEREAREAQQGREARQAAIAEWASVNYARRVAAQRGGGDKATMPCPLFGEDPAWRIQDCPGDEEGLGSHPEPDRSQTEIWREF